jgi:hypothetical protein
MIRLTQTRMKIHHASSIRPIKNKLFTDETSFIYYFSASKIKKNKIILERFNKL